MKSSVPTKCEIHEHICHANVPLYSTMLVIALVCVLHKQVAPVDHEVFSKWEQLDGIPQCDTVIAYLEDENSGYIVKEYFENSMHILNLIIVTIFHSSALAKVIDRTSKMIENKRTKLSDPIYLMYWRERVRLKKELNKLNQLLEHLFTNLINAVEYLHRLDRVVLKLHSELKTLLIVN